MESHTLLLIGSGLTALISLALNICALWVVPRNSSRHKFHIAVAVFSLVLLSAVAVQLGTTHA